MATRPHSAAEEASDREIVTTRVIDAPRERVFDAWTDPDRLVRWWGPNGFTSTFHEFDPRPGGVWRFVIHGPNGVDCRNSSVFVEVARPEKIVLDHVSPPRFRLVATFADRAGKAELTFCQRFGSAEECNRIKTYAAEANEQNLDRLEAELKRSV